MKKKIKKIILLIMGAFVAGLVFAVWDTPTIKFVGRDPAKDDDYNDYFDSSKFVDDLD